MEVTQVVPKDAIPSVDDPSFVEEYGGDPDDEVVVVEGDPPRAYPVRYLNFHEIVNDRIDGDPVAVTWCPLCGSAVVYDREVDGRTLEFGVSGKLADDDLVMYDRQTESEWKQSLGEAIAGEYEGTVLRVRPSSVTTYGQFASDRDGVVMAPPGGESEASGEGPDPEPIEYDEEPYRDYFEGDGFGLAAHRGGDGRDWGRDDDLGPKDVVLGVEDGEDALGFPTDRVAAAGGVARAVVGDRDVVVFVTPDGVHAFEADGRDFEPTDDDAEFAADGTRWNGATGESLDGRSLDRIPAKRLFAFAWQDDHGTAGFWGDPQV